jgi:hypothetical protein
MLEKIVEAVFGYCFAILEVFDALLGRTHALVGLGLPLLATVAVHLFLPRWASVALAAFVWIPAGAAMGTVVASGWAQTRQR